jgi:hypothetical protein
MGSRWSVVLLAMAACGGVEQNDPLAPPVVSLSPERPGPKVELMCVITTPSDGGAGPITYTASWTRNGLPYTNPPLTTTFTNDTVPAADVGIDDDWQCTVTASDGRETVTASSEVGKARCVTGGMAEFAANGTPPNGTVQQFAVPPGVCRMTIEAGGGQGGDSQQVGATNGARIIGTFNVSSGQMLTILVGQMAGTNGVNRLAGGGGTFVIGPNNMPMVIAGGGGANFAGTIAPSESVGRAVPSGGTVGATLRADNGAGGNVVAGSPAGGGGGFMTAGMGVGGGAGYMQGGNGGGTECSGGYGGGGGRTNLFGEGGGGGYSGGSCGNTTNMWAGCGGGGSFNGGMSQSNTAGAVTGNGYVKITW